MAEMTLVASHFDRDLTAQEHAELQDWLSQSPDHVRDFVEWSVMEMAVEELFETSHARTVHDRITLRQMVTQSERSSIEGDAAAIDRDEAWYEGLIPETPEIEESTSSSLPFKDAMGLLGYVCREASKTKPVRQLAVVAAIMLVALIAWQIWSPAAPQQDEIQPPLAGNTPPDPPDVSTPTIVATLTAEHDAVWERRPGQDLYAGQRFTLTEGFAKITTTRGAVAILEAPVTIELLDNDNALRLHTGKLVGVCETESSKGFVVRTPQMDITDIGTRFGVDVSAGNDTQVHVIEGSVSYSNPARGGDDRRLTAGEVVSVDARGNEQQAAYDPLRFVDDREFQARQDADGSAQARSLAARYERARAGGVLLDLSFEAGPAGGVGAASFVDHDHPLSLNVDTLVPGRFGDLTAVRLSDDKHFIEASIDQPLQQVTLAGWYYIDRLEHVITSLAQGHSVTGLHWNIRRSNNGTAQFNLVQVRERGQQLDDWTDAQSKPIRQDALTGRWVHLATTLDVASGEAAIYMDGRHIASGRAEDLEPIALGGFQIGNWQAGESGERTDPDRALRGAVEEFVVFDRVLTPDKIKSLYQSTTH